MLESTSRVCAPGEDLREGRSLVRTQAPENQVRCDVLVVFASPEKRLQLLRAVAAAGMTARPMDSLEEGKCALADGDFEIVICEDLFSEEMIEEARKHARLRAKPIPVIVGSRVGEWAEFLSVLRQGAFDCVPLPPQPEEVKRILNLAAAELRRATGKSRVLERSEAENGRATASPEIYRVAANSRGRG